MGKISGSKNEDGGFFDSIGIQVEVRQRFLVFVSRYILFYTTAFFCILQCTFFHL